MAGQLHAGGACDSQPHRRPPFFIVLIVLTMPAGPSACPRIAPLPPPLLLLPLLLLQPVMVLGNVSSVLSVAYFGLSGSYAQAVAARAVGGALNAVILCAKAIIGGRAPVVVVVVVLLPLGCYRLLLPASCCPAALLPCCLRCGIASHCKDPSLSFQAPHTCMLLCPQAKACPTSPLRPRALACSACAGGWAACRGP